MITGQLDLSKLLISQFKSVYKNINGNKKDLPNKRTIEVKIKVLEISKCTTRLEEQNPTDYKEITDINLCQQAFEIPKFLMSCCNAFIDGFKAYGNSLTH